MTVILRHSETIELNLVEYRGGVTLAELKALAAFMAAHPAYLQRDTLNLILPGADFNACPTPSLDALFDYYRTLFAPLKLQIMRRAAWVCGSAAAQTALDHWLGHDIREGMTSTVRQFTNLADAGDWLVLTEAEISLVESGKAFSDIARFSAAAVR
jgi:hypothetical protein